MKETERLNLVNVIDEEIHWLTQMKNYCLVGLPKETRVWIAKKLLIDKQLQGIIKKLKKCKIK